MNVKNLTPEYMSWDEVVLTNKITGYKLSGETVNDTFYHYNDSSYWLYGFTGTGNYTGMVEYMVKVKDHSWHSNTLLN